MEAKESSPHLEASSVVRVVNKSETYTDADELVLDTTYGSASTAVACKNTQRRFVGWELDEKYYRTALERVGNEVDGNYLLPV